MSIFDKDLKVGDIIKAYHKGIHQVTKIERRFYTIDDEKRKWGKCGEEYNSLIHYDKILDSHFKKCNKKSDSCDSAYCKKITIEWIKEELETKRKTLEEAFSRLLKIIETTNNLYDLQ